MKTRAELNMVPTRTIFEQEVNGITRKLQANAAYDLKAEGFGIHGVELVVVVERKPVAIELLWMTGWHLPKVREGLDTLSTKHYEFSGIGSVSYHSPIPLYEGQSLRASNCQVTGGKCYSDSSFLASGEIFDQFVADPDSLWKELERRLVEQEKEIEKERKEMRSQG